MEQKNYKLETVRILLKGKNHIRGIAKELGMNHMMILRKIQELAKDNVVDFKQEGKNKAYFLKRSVEARSYTLMAEEYALIQTLKKYPLLRMVIEKIQENKQIRFAILFGSFAKGLAKKDSDIDIYIETNDGEIKKKISLIDTRLSIKIGGYDKKDNLIKEIEKNHVILKGVEEYYEKNQFFS